MRRPLLAVAAAVAAAVTGLASCGGSSSTGAATTKQALTGTVYFLIPNATTPRFLNEDTPFFKKYLHQDAPGLNVVVENANNDAATQQSQVENAITKGAAAIVLIVVDPFQAAGELRDAATAHIPVIAYDHNAQNGPLAAYDVYNSLQIGQLQAAAACKFLSAGSGTMTLARIMGNAGEYGTTRYYAGQNQCLTPLINSGKVKIVCQTYTPNWLPAAAQQEAEACLTRTRDKVSAFLDMNDSTSGAVIAALAPLHLTGKVPVFGGQDADLPELQYIAEGYQQGTIFKSFEVEAQVGAALTVAVIQHKKTLPYVNGTYPNGYGSIPTALLTPEYVTAPTIGDVVKAGIYTWQQICTGSAAATATCKAQGM